MSKVTVLLSSNEFARLDAYCGQHSFKKSTLIARLILEYLDVQEFPKQDVLPLDNSRQKPAARARTREGD